MCRVGLPQTVDVCARLGANAPATVPALVRGCLRVAQAATKTVQATASEDHEDQAENENGAAAQANTAWQSIQALAALSPYQGAQTSTVLKLSKFKTTPFAAQRLALQLAVQRQDALGIALCVDKYVNHEEWSKAKDVCRAAVECLSQELSSTADQNHVIPRARLEWILTAFLRLLAFGIVGSTASYDWMKALQDNISSLSSLTHRIMVAIAWLGFAHSSASNTKQGKDNVLSCGEVLSNMISKCPMRYAAFCAHAVATWKEAKPESLGFLLGEVLGLKDSAIADWLVSTNRLTASCAPVLELFPVEEVLQKGINEESVRNDPGFVARCLSSPPTSNLFDEAEVRMVLKTVLGIDHPVDFLVQPDCMDLLRKACSFLGREEMKERHLPLVLPLQLESTALKARDSLLVSDAPVVKEVSTLILNLAYGLCFMQEQPESPFCADLRSLPVNEIYLRIASMPSTTVHRSFREYIRCGIGKRCPEVKAQSRVPDIVRQALILPSLKMKGGQFKTELTKSIRDIIGDSSKDPSGEKVEECFCRAVGSLPQDVLCSTVASAVLSIGYPLVSFPYTKLCKDPLILLKCPMYCWDRPGCRKVLLVVLSSLFRVNDALLNSPEEGYEEASDEYLVARNVVTIRCLLVLMKKCLSMRSCPVTTSFIRLCVAQCPGVGAALLRQGIDDAEIDWMIAHVPEIIDDGQAFQTLLGLQTISTTAERLVAASGVLRIAIVYGHRNEAQAQALALASLSQLIANFFIVIGPVGIPVQTFVGENQGSDATYICRTAAIRMLKSMSYVRGHRHGLRNECVMALQKLARLCKGEEIVGGLPASLAHRQKSFIREMLDGISKALTAMGSNM